MTDISNINALRLLQSADKFRARLSGEFASVHGLSVNEYFLLMHLAQAEGNRLSRIELAKRMHVSASTITRMFTPMEKIGLVARQADARDARIGFVTTTEAGQVKLSEAQATFAKQAGYLFQDRWENEEKEQLAELLSRFIAGSASNLSADDTLEQATPSASSDAERKNQPKSFNAFTPL